MMFKDGNGVIPTLRDHPDLTPFGGCRLCIVEVQIARLPVASCATPVAAGITIDALDPVAKIPEYKVAAVKVELVKA